MLDNKGFDLWADGYDKSVGLSDEENTYPFAGYKDVLGTIYKTIMEKPNAVVLDIGFGTGTLTTKLYENGCTIYGQDFSARMIELASEKMPNAHLYQGDFTQGLVEPLLAQRYDFIVEYFTELYLGQPYERDANDFAYEKVKALLGDSPELQELHAFWTPKKAIEDQAYEELYRQIDEITGETNESEDTSPTDG